MNLQDLIHWIALNVKWPSIYPHKNMICAYFYDHKGKGPYELKKEFKDGEIPDYKEFLEKMKSMFEGIIADDEAKEEARKKKLNEQFEALQRKQNAN